MTSKPSSEKLKLTEYLMQLDPEAFQKATQVKFLEKAGRRELEKEVLEKWLSQDRLYAQAYVRFASLLLAGVRLPAAISPTSINERLRPLFFLFFLIPSLLLFLSYSSQILNSAFLPFPSTWKKTSSIGSLDINKSINRLADLLLDTLSNIRRELKFFESVAAKYSLDINAAEDSVSEGVKGYRELFFSTGEGIEKGELPLLDGLVLLWATEIVNNPFLSPPPPSLPFSISVSL
jgi:hypothetical protein